jgi:Zn-dependent protease
MAIRFHYNTGLLELGHYRGAPVYLSPAFFLVAAGLAFPFWRMVSLTGLMLALVFMLALLASILMHELAHAVVGRHYHVQPQRIDINMAGGVVHFRGHPHKMAHDLAITAAGPLCNLVLGFAAVAFLWMLPTREAPMIQIGSELVRGVVSPTFLERVLRAIAYLNIGLCVVNLLPGVPLDGGKILYLLVQKHWNTRVALMVVSAVGLVFACVSTFFLIGTLIAGFPIWAPPEFRINWRAFVGASQRIGDWDTYTA